MNGCKYKKPRIGTDEMYESNLIQERDGITDPSRLRYISWIIYHIIMSHNLCNVVVEKGYSSESG
jgi:hypothetical protein